MQPFVAFLIYFGIGFLTGLIVGIFGISGGSLRIPLLNIAGLSLITAYGINLCVIPFSSGVAVIPHRKKVEWNTAKYMIFGGSIGTVIGTIMAFYLSMDIIFLASIFVVEAFLTVLWVNLYKIFPKFTNKFTPSVPMLVGGTVTLNALTGLRGGSGGALFPPFLRFLNLDMHKAIATSLFTTIFTATVATVLYWSKGQIDLKIALYVLGGSLIGPPLGGLISIKSKPRWLEIGISFLVILLSFLPLYKILEA
ncbi:MAG: sulfite exporter TauE/SafE family protein [Candidatus Heimdallarchaeaceae archaeon]